MSQKSDGMNYAPVAKAKPVVKPGEFVFAASHLEHGHIFGQVNGLKEAGGVLKYVYDPDPKKAEGLRAKHPEAVVVDDFRRILDDPAVHLVASAGVPSERGPTGIAVMRAGKDAFVDKTPFTSLDQLADARKACAETGRRYVPYYGELVHNEAAWTVGELLKDGLLGKVLHLAIMGPHRLGKPGRPWWFWEKKRYGGILTDIASHQFDQFLAYTGAAGGTVEHARVANFANPDKPEFEDFGEAVLRLDTGASAHARVDWFTPDGLRSWGDGRTFIVGTQGTIEIRKYLDLGGESRARILHVDDRGEREIPIDPEMGFPFFGKLILDTLNRTETATTLARGFMAAELALKAQAFADARR